MAQSITDPRILDHDPATGITEYFYSNADGTEFTIETRQDITELVEVNRRIQNDSTGRWGEMAHIASYPLCVWWENKQKHLYDDDREHRRWLNDPDQRVFRCKLGRV